MTKNEMKKHYNIKSIHEKHIANIILNERKTQSNCTKLRNKTRVPLSLLLVIIIHGLSSFNNSKNGKLKNIQIGKEEI